MKKLVSSLTDFLIKKFTKDDPAQRVNDPLLRKEYAFLEAWMSITGNFVLAVFKFIFGIILNSISLIADAVHTAADVITSVIVIIGFKLSSMPADEKHPHGHGRIEFIATLIIALILIIVGVKFGMSSYYRYIENTAVKGSYLVAFLMVLAALSKELMSLISTDLGSRIKSSALVADAWHHRTDAIASFLVAIAILGSKFGYFKVDAILGFAVSTLIIYTGVEIFIDSCSKLIGEIDQEELDYINFLALSVKGVLNTHEINVHDYGATKEISLHIEVKKNLSMLEAHEIADQVEKVIEENTASRTVVHVDSIENDLFVD